MKKRAMILTLLIVVVAAGVEKIYEKRFLENKEIEVFFNKRVYGKYGEKSWGEINLEEQLIEFIQGAEKSIDVCIYEINLPGVVSALIKKAHEGIDVRLIVDAKDDGGEKYRNKRYELMRLYLEKLRRGCDNIIGTEDDVMIFADSPIFMVEDKGARGMFSLPKNIERNTFEFIQVGEKTKEGYLLCWGEILKEDVFAAPQNQMHNKFVVVDGVKVWTGSWNFTVTGLYGGYNEAVSGELEGNQQHCIILNSREAAKIFTAQFNEMWGGGSIEPDPNESNFGKRKTLRNKHTIEIDHKRVDIYFSPNPMVLGDMEKIFRNKNNDEFYMSLFCISHVEIVDILLERYFKKECQVSMVIDEGMWKQGWSAVRRSEYFKGYAPIFEDNVSGKLHSKSGVVDPFEDDSIVITGSMNWTKNGAETNDENMIIIYGDDKVAQRFYGEIMSRISEGIP